MSRKETDILFRKLESKVSKQIDIEVTYQFVLFPKGYLNIRDLIELRIIYQGIF